MFETRRLSRLMVLLACTGAMLGWIVTSATANNCREDCWCGEYVTTGTYPNADCGGESFNYASAICRSKGTVWCAIGCEAEPHSNNGINTTEFELAIGGGCSGCFNVNNGFWQEQSGVNGTYVFSGHVPQGECSEPGG